MGWESDVMGWGGHWFGGMFTLVFWILVIVVTDRIIRGFTSRFTQAGRLKIPSPSVMSSTNHYLSASGTGNTAEGCHSSGRFRT